MNFVRFINQKHKKDIKLIGGSDFNKSETMYRNMLRAIVDFTIPKSTCNVFYKDKRGKIKAKQFYKDCDEGFYINGNTFKTHEKLFKMFND